MGVLERIYRIEHDGAVRFACERDGICRLIEGSPFDAFSLGEQIRLDDHRLLSPVVPTKIVAVGVNYRDHAAETGSELPREPLVFLKPSTAVIGPREAIRLPPGVGRVDHEAEMAVVIGKQAYRVAAENAAAYIFGLSCFNDVTARELQSRDVQFTRGKGFDTFAPLGPCVARGIDAGALPIEGWVNSERRQASNTSQLVFTVPRLVSFISHVMTLLPGDVIATGTPAGIGPIAAGDVVTIRIPPIGELSNPVEQG